MAREEEGFIDAVGDSVSVDYAGGLGRGCGGGDWGSSGGGGRGGEVVGC